MLLKQLLLAAGLSFFVLSSMAQTDSNRLRISLLTCTPGTELYSTFGHTAIRVTDSSRNSDIVYNYGTFNFDDDGFYLKFVQGKLNYYLSAEYFDDFRYLYQQENRGITEQVFRLSASSKQRLQKALEDNLLPGNRFYKYDFFFDNCTTRARDMLFAFSDTTVSLKATMPQGTRFRQAIHAYLDKNHNYWSKLGIDLLLGAPTDRVMTAKDMQFLPDNLMAAVDSCNQNKMLLSGKADLYTLPKSVTAKTLFTPLVFFCLLLAVIAALGFSKNKFIQHFLQGFDGLLFFLTGLLGIILAYMTTATDHTMCRNNYNLLWAWPTHLAVAFFTASRKKWVLLYFKITAAAMAAVLLSWFFLPQQMNPALLPVILLLIYRCIKKIYQ